MKKVIIKSERLYELGWVKEGKEYVLEEELYAIPEQFVDNEIIVNKVFDAGEYEYELSNSDYLIHTDWFEEV